jgi:hypothetical protein
MWGYPLDPAEKAAVEHALQQVEHSGVDGSEIRRGRAPRWRPASQEPSTFAEADEGPMVLSVAETKQVVAIQRAADLDPDAYVEACRAKGR